MLIFQSSQIEDIFSAAREANPLECCGLIAGSEAGDVLNVYRLRNVAVNPDVAYEVAPEELFLSQRNMRERGEQLLAIYHSHPQAVEPEPSPTDIRLAYYPSAVYFIVGLAGPTPIMRGFQLFERERRWQEVEYAVFGE